MRCNVVTSWWYEAHDPTSHALAWMTTDWVDCGYEQMDAVYDWSEIHPYAVV